MLYFIEKNAPLLEPWEREVVRIVRKIAQYFYPQRQTKVMNEGWATFWHYTLLHTLYDEGYVNDGFMFEFLQTHTNVIYQPEFDSPYFNGINPYTLGYAIYSDIRRICEQPTDEDERFFPDFAGGDWLDTIHHAMANFKDESFILQFLSPKVIRDLKLFSILDDDKEREVEVIAIHDDSGYRQIREELADQFNLSKQEPNIQVQEVDLRGDRSITLWHLQHDRIPLSDNNAKEVMKHLRHLWRFDVHLESMRDESVTSRYICDDESVRIVTGERAAQLNGKTVAPP
jgi:spore cortex formation protein SpoVR/YcgB (stage V sporulation)